MPQSAKIIQHPGQSPAEHNRVKPLHVNKAIAPTIQDVNDDILLGYLFGSSLSKIEVKPEELLKLFENNNLPTHFVNHIKNHDAFRRATASVQNKRIEVSYNGSLVDAKLEMDEIRCDDDEIVRYLGRKIINKTDEELNYTKVTKIVFNRNDGTIKTRTNKKIIDEYPYRDIVKAILTEYHNNTEYHNEKTLRNIISKIISSMHPISIMDNGYFKFIPKKYKEMLFNVQGLINNLSEIAPGQRLEVFPLINTDDINKILLKAVNNSASKEINAIMRELQDGMSKGIKFHAKTIKTYKERFKFYKEEMLVYEELLDTSMSSVAKLLSKAIRMVDTSDA
jgi:hypothetical protein